MIKNTVNRKCPSAVTEHVTWCRPSIQNGKFNLDAKVIKISLFLAYSRVYSVFCNGDLYALKIDHYQLWVNSGRTGQLWTGRVRKNVGVEGSHARRGSTL